MIYEGKDVGLWEWKEEVEVIPEIPVIPLDDWAKHPIEAKEGE